MKRKIVKWVHGPKKMEEENFRRISNCEIDESLKDILRTIKAKNIQWYEHLNNGREDSELRRIANWRPSGGRARGKQKNQGNK